MEKTPQDIEAAVLAYCHEVCPKTGDKWGSKCETFSLSNNGPLMGQQWKLSFNGYELRIDSGMDGIYSMLCYYIFGLDKRDALEAERGKSAKLVEAFEEIKAMKIYGDDDTDQGFESESDAYHEIKHLTKNTLEAYKEGKKDE